MRKQILWAVLPALFLVSIARADITFTGIAAGDATAKSAIVWTRAVDLDRPATTALTLQYGTDESFAASKTLTVNTLAARDYTAKTDLTDLQPGTRYFYRFSTAAGVRSASGTFKTAPDATSAAEVKLAFSGDVHTQWRPYASSLGIAKERLDFFVFIGDTIYETGSKASDSLPDSAGLATTDTTTAAATPEKLLAEYRIKYREQFFPVNKGGQPSLAPFFAAQGNYTLLDNHELGNKQYIEGGAPQGPPIDGVAGTAASPGATKPEFDVNATGKFMNQVPAYRSILQAYLDYEPVRETLVDAPTEPRSHGTPRQYYAQQWGKNLMYINVDDRSYRDVRMKNATGDDTGSRANNPARTMLGATQLAWLEKSLLDAQRAGTTWKIVAVSSPIDQIDEKGKDGGEAGADGGKSWYGGYRAERNMLLKFIADNAIKNVVFITTDDHLNRVNELSYFKDAVTFDQKTAVRVPAAFTIVAGPIGASDPDKIKDHTFASLKKNTDAIAKEESAEGVDPIGLAADYPGLHDVFREDDPDADKLRQPIDFYSPDTFNYAVLRVSADGKTLSVDTWGITAYAPNTFPELSPANPIRRILGFKITAQ